jgi:hypothetical protein
MLGSMFCTSPVNWVSWLPPCRLIGPVGNVDTILLLLSWDKQQDPSATSEDGSALLISLFDTPNDITDTVRLLLRLSKFNFFAASETGDNILHVLSAKSSREVSAAVIWALWSRDEAQLAKKEKNRQGKTPYQVCLCLSLSLSERLVPFLTVRL